MRKLGIDFGTSNSSAGLYLGSEVQRVPVSGRHECYQFPTVAFLADDGRILTSHEAENEAELDPQRFIREFKLEIDDPTELPAGNGIKYDDVVSAILKTIKADAERFANCSIEEAVITIPALYGMGDRRREVMRRAAARAGFKKVDLLLEPEAAAIYYAHRLRETAASLGELTLVYDLGAGTFDPALIRRIESGWQLVPVSMRGVPCAGARFDERLREHFHLTVQPDNQIGDELTRYQTDLMIERFCKEAKHALSGQEIFRKLEPITRRKRYEITRNEFSRMIDPLLEETLSCCENLLKRAQVTWKNVGQVLLVGGSCNIPRVREKLEERIRSGGGSETRVCWSTVEGIYISPDYAVCLGAALPPVEVLRPIPSPPTDEVQSGSMFARGSLRDQLSTCLEARTGELDSINGERLKKEDKGSTARSAGRQSTPDKIESIVPLKEQLRLHYIKQGNECAELLDEIHASLGRGDLEQADQLTIRLIRLESGYQVFDSETKANSIPEDLLRQLVNLWRHKASSHLSNRKWVQCEGEVTTWIGFFSLTTWLRQRFDRIDL